MSLNLYNQRFQLLQENGEPYKLRKQQITQMVMRYRIKNYETQFTETYDFNIDETNNCVWVRMPQNENLEWFLVIQVGELRTVETPLQTTFFSTNLGLVKTYAVPCPINTLQGHSPYLNKQDNYWYQYNDTIGAFECTYVKGETTITTDHPIVDVIELGNMSATTSNIVAQLSANTFSQINANTTQINNLKAHKVSTTISINDEVRTATEDASGVIDLGSIEIPNGIENLHYVANHLTETDNKGNLLPKGSVLKEDNSVFSLSSPHQYFNQSYITNQWYYICNINGSATINVTLSVYNSTYGGVIYVTRNGYNYEAVTTNPHLASLIKVYNKSINGYLVIKGQQYVGMSGKFEVTNGSVVDMGTPITSYNFNPNDLTEMDVFMTSYTEKEDYINIETNNYTTSAETLEVYKYNLMQSGTTNFTFADEVMYPTILYFVATQDDTIVSVKDSTNEWTATSETLNQGDLAILTYVDKDNFSWTYSTKREYEVTSNKVTAITETNKNSAYLYPSLKAMTTWADNRYGQGNVKSIMLNNETYTANTQGVVDLGDVCDPLYKLWVSTEYKNKAVSITQYTLGGISGDKTKSLASTNFVVDYFSDNSLNEIIVNGKSHTPSTDTPNSINIGKFSIKANGNTYSFNAENVCDLGTIGGQTELPKTLVYYNSTNKSLYDGNSNTMASVNGNVLSILGLDITKISGVTLNGSAHTISNGNIDLGKEKVKFNGNTFSADTNNLINIGGVDVSSVSTYWGSDTALTYNKYYIETSGMSEDERGYFLFIDTPSGADSLRLDGKTSFVNYEVPSTNTMRDYVRYKVSGMVTNLTASTSVTANTSATKSFIRFKDGTTYTTYDIGATWVHTNEGKTATEVVSLTSGNTRATPTIALMKEYVGEQVGGTIETNATFTSGTSLVTFSNDTEVEIRCKGKKVVVNCISGATYVESGSLNNDKIDVLLSDQSGYKNTIILATSYDAEIKVLSGSVSVTKSGEASATTITKTSELGSITLATDDVSPFTLICGNGDNVIYNGSVSTVLENIRKYISSTTQTSYAKFISVPLCTRQDFEQVRTYTNTDTTSTFNITIKGRNADKTYYQLIPTTTISVGDSGRVVTYTIKWDARLQKWLLV